MNWGLALLIVLSNALFYWIGYKCGEENKKIENFSDEIEREVREEGRKWNIESGFYMDIVFWLPLWHHFSFALFGTMIHRKHLTIKYGKCKMEITG